MGLILTFSYMHMKCLGAFTLPTIFLSLTPSSCPLLMDPFLLSCHAFFPREYVLLATAFCCLSVCVNQKPRLLACYLCHSGERFSLRHMWSHLSNWKFEHRNTVAQEKSERKNEIIFWIISLTHTSWLNKKGNSRTTLQKRSNGFKMGKLPGSQLVNEEYVNKNQNKCSLSYFITNIWTLPKRLVSQETPGCRPKVQIYQGR